MKNTITLLIIFMLQLSCMDIRENRPKNDSADVKTIVVDFGKEYTKKKFPNTNSFMKVQKLEDDKEHPIGQVDKLIVKNGNIYILDRTKAKSIFVYTKGGKLQHVINRIGGGPGEFVTPQDFDVDGKTGNIIVMDIDSRKLVVYSANGEYINDIKYDFFATSFILDEDGNLILDRANVDLYYLSKLNKKGEVLDNFFPTDTAFLGITFNPRRPLQMIEKDLLYLPTLSYSIYTINDDNPIPIYEIDFGKN